MTMALVNRAELLAASYEIAAGQGMGYVASDTLSPDQDVAIEPACAITVYSMPDSSNPLLHKAYLPFNGVSYEVAKIFRDWGVGKLISRAPVVSHNSMRVIAEDIATACEETEVQETDDRPFRILGMLAVYAPGSKNIPPPTFIFMSKSFLDTLVGQVTDMPDEEFSDEYYKRMYAMQTEHKIDIEPYEQWRENMETTSSNASGQEKKLWVAFGKAAYLLLPKQDSHPILDDALFRERS